MTLNEPDSRLVSPTTLEPLGIKRFYTDDRGAYERHLDENTHIIGKKNTQNSLFELQLKFPQPDYFV